MTTRLLFVPAWTEDPQLRSFINPWTDEATIEGMRIIKLDDGTGQLAIEVPRYQTSIPWVLTETRIQRIIIDRPDSPTTDVGDGHYQETHGGMELQAIVETSVLESGDWAQSLWVSCTALEGGWCDYDALQTWYQKLLMGDLSS